MRKSISFVLLAAACVAYVGLTAFVGWLTYQGHTPEFIRSYTLGTNAAWAVVGIMLSGATEWFRGFRNT